MSEPTHDEIRAVVNQIGGFSNSHCIARWHLNQVAQLLKEKAELEAKCAVYREALREADMYISSFHIDWSKFNHGSPDHDADYNPEFPEVIQMISKALSKTAGKDLLEKVGRMEVALNDIKQDIETDSFIRAESPYIRGKFKFILSKAQQALNPEARE